MRLRHDGAARRVRALSSSSDQAPSARDNSIVTALAAPHARVQLLRGIKTNVVSRVHLCGAKFRARRRRLRGTRYMPKAATKKTAKKPAAKKKPAKKAARKVVAKKATRKGAVKKASAKKTSARRTAAKKSAGKKSAAKKSAAKRAPAKRKKSMPMPPPSDMPPA